MCAHVYNSHGRAKSRREHFIALRPSPLALSLSVLSSTMAPGLGGVKISLILAQGRTLNCHLLSAGWVVSV